MPKVQRSPPSTPINTKSTPCKSQSNPDVSMEQYEQSQSNLTKRSVKRLRADGSPETETQTITHGAALSAETFHASQKALTDMITSWKTEQNIILSKLVSEVSVLKEKCDAIQNKNNDIERSIEYMNQDFEEMRQKIESLEEERKSDKESIAKLERKLLENEGYRRTSAIEIRNVPSKEKETTDDLIATVSKVGEAIGLKIQVSDIRDIQRLPGKPGIPKAIVTEFSAVKIKTDFLTSIRTFNRGKQLNDKLNTLHLGLTGEKRPVYVDEHLPTSTKKLLLQSRSFAKKNNYNFCWHTNGKILLRKNKDSKEIHTITSEQSLMNLESQT